MTRVMKQKILPLMHILTNSTVKPRAVIRVRIRVGVGVRADGDDMSAVDYYTLTC